MSKSGEYNLSEIEKRDEMIEELTCIIEAVYHHTMYKDSPALHDLMAKAIAKVRNP